MIYVAPVLNANMMLIDNQETNMSTNMYLQ